MLTKQFIQEIQRRPVIWDPKEKFYYKRHILMGVWKEISEIFNIEVLAAKQKWKNLRDNFRVEYRKYLLRQQHPLAVSPEVKWIHFNDMMFLAGVLKRRMIPVQVSTPPQTQERKSELIEGLSIKTEPETFTESLPTYSTAYNSVAVTYKLEENPTGAQVEQEKHQASNFFLLADEDSNDESNLSSNSIPTTVQSVNSEETDGNDDDLIFFKTLLPMVKKLPESEKLLFRIEIQQLLYNKLYKDRQ